MAGDTRTSSYANRLQAFDRGWRRWLDVQRPYRWNIRRLGLGFTLDVGCGVGRNLLHLGGRSAGVGIDHSPPIVELARARGLEVFTPEQFAASPFARPGRFDSLLLAHVIEHMHFDQARALIETHLPYLRAGGKLVMLVPQEAGFRSDPTHVEYFRAQDLTRLAGACGLTPIRTFSFPFPAIVGKAFPHNETIMLAAWNRPAPGR
jgi:SAM-dependent methyltransferase